MARNGLLKSHSTTKPANGYIFENGTKTLWTQGESTQEKTNAHTNGFANGISKSNGVLSSNGVSPSAPNGGPPINEDPPLYPRKWAENFESVPYMTAILTFFGFYLLMIMGYTGTESTCLNLASYNYLGFGENTGLCTERSKESVKQSGCALCSPSGEIGTHKLHLEVEALTAQFLGVESCMVIGMGYASNTLNLPSLVNEGCLVLSDEKNHASLITGLKVSRATVRVFRHNSDLEAGLQKALLEGQPHSGKPWRKILIVVEGIFSMDGSIVRLPEIVRLKNKYKAYLYVDEAHSIGALGPTGRGVTEYFGIDPREVDILMGTYTKSFGSMGGYVAGSKSTIDYIRANSHVRSYATSMPPPVAMQILTSMRIIMGLENGDEGIRRISVLAHNTRYFRRKLNRLGLIVYGHRDSPVVPVLVFFFSKVGAVVRELKARGIAAVGVGFPATPLMKARIRFCVSASHTKEQLDEALEKIEEVADKLGLRYSRRKFPADLKSVEWGESDDDDY
ncbi:hypothetical protein M8J76_004590 [Diaphorina citri]|nr:hypothetical protein M8J76_004590 [Diaphorina citri]